MRIVEVRQDDFEEWVGLALELCAELASDALLDNIASHKFHQQTGFQEVERIVTFIKSLTL